MPSNVDIANWTHCLACFIRRDHVYDPETKTWRCGFCGVVNPELTTLRKALSTIAESYLEDNPEED